MLDQPARGRLIEDEELVWRAVGNERQDVIEARVSRRPLYEEQIAPVAFYIDQEHLPADRADGHEVRNRGGVPHREGDLVGALTQFARDRELRGPAKLPGALR